MTGALSLPDHNSHHPRNWSSNLMWTLSDWTGSATRCHLFQHVIIIITTTIHNCCQQYYFHPTATAMCHSTFYNVTLIRSTECLTSTLNNRVIATHYSARNREYYKIVYTFSEPKRVLMAMIERCAPHEPLDITVIGWLFSYIRWPIVRLQIEELLWVPLYFSSGEEDVKLTLWLNRNRDVTEVQVV